MKRFRITRSRTTRVRLCIPPPKRPDLSLLVCATTPLTTLYGFWAGVQVLPLIPKSPGNSILLLGMVLLDGVLKFCFFVALLAVFVRVARLK